MTRRTRPVSWIKPALKVFETFPDGARSICLAALTIAAEGGKADVATAGGKDASRLDAALAKARELLAP